MFEYVLLNSPDLILQNVCSIIKQWLIYIYQSLFSHNKGWQKLTKQPGNAANPIADSSTDLIQNFTFPSFKNHQQNQAKSQIDEYVQNEKTIINADIHQITDDFNTDVNAKKQSIINIADEKIQEMSNIYNDFSKLIKNVATKEEIDKYIGLE